MTTTANPLLSPSELPYGLPDFSKLGDEHFLPAFEAGCEEQLVEIKAITEQPEVSFENTVVAMELSGDLLSRTLLAFFNKTSSDTNETLQALEAEISPRLAAHEDAIHLNPALYVRLTQLRDTVAESLDPESQRLLRRYLLDFKFAGAELPEAARERVKKINERAAWLSAEFDRLLLADTNELAVHLADDSRLGGLTSAEKAALAAAAKESGKQGYLIALLNYSGHPLLEKLEDRELRAEILERTLSRGSRDNTNDTSSVIRELLELRLEKASLFGYASFADYVTAQQTAGSAANVHAMLSKIAPLAAANAKAEAAALASRFSAETGLPESAFAAHDWARYAERERAERFSIDTASLQPYFELKRVLKDGVFYAASRLFGLRFEPRPDLVGYHPDVEVFEVFFEDGSKCGLFLFDPFTRPSKHGGAWMNNLVDQSQLLDRRPVVVNNLNITKPAPGEVALMSFDEVNTLFHEFGHTLHSLLSNVRYPRLSGTSVERDFVEFPSQVNEMWMLWPEVLSNYAIHVVTGQLLDTKIGDRLTAAETFNQGFETTHYLAAAVLDLALHETPAVPEDLAEFERQTIEHYGLAVSQVPTRYRTNYFAHIFGGGYAAGYYGYIWSEVLDADTVDWFRQNGGLSRENGSHFARELLSRGGSLDPLELYKNFRGRPAEIAPLMKRRGLI
jgi:peptidyl-dipeptidase Dcp